MYHRVERLSAERQLVMRDQADELRRERQARGASGTAWRGQALVQRLYGRLRAAGRRRAIGAAKRPVSAASDRGTA